MAVSINVTDLVRIFRDRKRRDRDDVGDWLDRVAFEAEEIADAWREMHTELQKGSIDLLKHPRLLSTLSHFAVYANIGHFEALQGFYKSASTVAGGRLRPSVFDALMNGMGSVLQSREITRKLYEMSFSEIKSVYFVDDSNRAVDLGALSSAVKALVKEAAALKVLASNFRATG
jgi:hypothetical protein